ncbi:early nodulin-like protein 13 [Henckelia pumila]|uniref:early nodulin-like protein 13 n=1 Tax=Henckelia pumila TaxID=405737 RepID=UPI003C6DCCF1
MAAGCFSRLTKISSLVLLLLLSFVLIMGFSEATEYLVGGENDAWRMPSPEPDYLNRWSEKSSFLIGDSLVFVYDGSKDSVLLVTKEAYLACNKSSPLKKYVGGNTTVELERSGPYFFTSGMEGRCVTGQKVIVVVMRGRDGNLLPAYSSFPPGDAIDDTTWDLIPTPGGGGILLSGGLAVGLVVAALVGSFLVIV